MMRLPELSRANRLKEPLVSLVRKLKDLWLNYFSEHAPDRVLLQAIQECPPKSILEIGVGNLERSLKMIELAQRDGKTVAFTGVDLFEGRPKGVTPGVTLRLAHRELRAKGATVRLLPGDPHAALSRAANLITQVDLVVIAADQEGESLAKAWYFIPRMLSTSAKVFREELATGKQPKTFRLIPTAEIATLAARPHRRAA